jgi:hypothetical protein
MFFAVTRPMTVFLLFWLTIMTLFTPSVGLPVPVTENAPATLMGRTYVQRAPATPEIKRDVTNEVVDKEPLNRAMRFMWRTKNTALSL